MGIESVGFTGHRKIRSKIRKVSADWAFHAVHDAVGRAADSGASWFTSGGAPGMDMVFLGAVIMARSSRADKLGLRPETKLYQAPAGTTSILATSDPVDGFACDLVACAAIPFPGFWDYYKEISRDRKALIGQTERQLDVILQIDPDPGYSAAKMHKRNRWIVDNHDVIIAVYDGRRSGGTYHTLKYAREKGVPILWIDPVKKEERWIRKGDRNG